MGNILTYKQSIYDFLREFAQVYDENQVVANNQGLNADLKVNFPYITHSLFIESWDNDGLAQIYIYDKSNSSKKVYEIANQIEEKVKEGCVFNDIIIHKGSPFIQEMAQEDKTVKCLFMNLQINYV
ncbi:MAG: hypothetical protein ACRCWA_10835 [Clostridium butyricum]